MYFSVLFNLRDRDDLSTRDKIIGPLVSLVWRFHCIPRDTHRFYGNFESMQLSGQPVQLAEAEAVDEGEEEEREFEQQLSQWKKTEVSDTKTHF